jgi:hypothetical protein
MISYKKLSSLLFAILVVSSVGCSKKTLPTSEVNFLSGNSGTITMRAIGNGQKEQDGISDAERNAFNVILFRGLPESEQKTALVGTNEAEELAKNKSYFDKFYSQMRYKTFVMSSIPVSSLSKQNGISKSLAVDIKINLVALRKDLEQNNIIRKFGF